MPRTRSDLRRSNRSNEVQRGVWRSSPTTPPLGGLDYQTWTSLDRDQTRGTVTRRTRRDSFAKYLQTADTNAYIDPHEQRGIELLAKQFRVRLIGRRAWANGTEDHPNQHGDETHTEP